MNSKRQQIIDKLKLMFEDIQIKKIIDDEEVIYGYNTDLGKNVHPWKLDTFADDDLPGAIWKDSDAQAEKPEKNVHTHTINIEFIAYVTGSTSPEQAREIIEDVHKAIGKNSLFDGLAIRTVPGKNIIEIEQDKKIIGRIIVNFQIIYVTKEWEI